MIVQTPHTPPRGELRRLKNPVTGMFLHPSGSGEVSGTDHSWSGTIDQARTLKARASARREAFPYVLVTTTQPKGASHDAEYL
jgi:hypothetical protein